MFPVALLLILTDSVTEQEMMGGQRKKSTDFGGTINVDRWTQRQGCRLLSHRLVRIVSGQRDTHADSLPPPPQTQQKRGKVIFLQERQLFKTSSQEFTKDGYF